MPTNLSLGVTAVMLPELDFDEQIALCRELGVTHYSVRPRDIPHELRDKPWGNWGNHKFDLTPKRLVEEAAAIKAKLLDAGLTPFGTVPAINNSITDEDLKLHLEGAAAVDAGRMRVAPAPYDTTRVFDYEALLEKQIADYQRVVALAKTYGIKVVIETHARSLASSPALALNICRHFEPADLGVIFDIANFCIEGGILPHLAVSVLHRYIDHVHVGGSYAAGGSYDANGFRKQATVQCPINETSLYLPDWIGALRQAELGTVPLVIEDYTAGPPGRLRLRNSATALKRLL